MVKYQKSGKNYSYTVIILLFTACTNNFVHFCLFFRLILIAEKNKVYEEFPTPLINRLEKHFVVTSTVLTDIQKQLLKELEAWATEYACIGLVVIASIISLCLHQLHIVLILETLKLEMHLWGTKKILLLQ